MREAIRGHQRSSEVIRGPQRSSEVHQEVVAHEVPRVIKRVLGKSFVLVAPVLFICSVSKIEVEELLRLLGEIKQT